VGGALETQKIADILIAGCQVVKKKKKNEWVVVFCQPAP
jgi:hypothetical protein